MVWGGGGGQHALTAGKAHTHTTTHAQSPPPPPHPTHTHTAHLLRPQVPGGGCQRVAELGRHLGSHTHIVEPARASVGVGEGDGRRSPVAAPPPPLIARLASPPPPPHPPTHTHNTLPPVPEQQCVPELGGGEGEPLEQLAPLQSLKHIVRVPGGGGGGGGGWEVECRWWVGRGGEWGAGKVCACGEGRLYTERMAERMQAKTPPCAHTQPPAPPHPSLLTRPRQRGFASQLRV